MNLKIREFRLALENYISNTEIPVEVKRMVLKELYTNTLSAANDAISAELDERERKDGEKNE